MRLPDADKARVDNTKVTDYLLSPSHPDGRNKAAFFSAFGFTIESPEVLRQALQKHGATQSVTGTAESGFGKRYTVEGPLETPDRRNPTIRTVWIVAHVQLSIADLLVAVVANQRGAVLVTNNPRNYLMEEISVLPLKD